ncbi:radial spoke protein 7 [Stylonychia lemnae]|uniref:Radial spoke protein 7 n=1 Tax=Stylonychia lemnae TaxID=5949 RepID=A0A078AJU5_STYLE|nr:radial spoke protein 7 [Stylonychia lemnae]|eukprot:CDW82161.1 radial spoke protein 7 [Stylonychia lemnae]
MREEEGVEYVKKIVNEWSKVYINQVFFINKFSNIYNYEVEFSKPHSIKPIPEGTVKVFFSLIEKANGDCIVEFNFENESLKHKLDNTMRTNMFEQWIDRVLENKLKIKMQLHLGTEFEYTRTVDEKGKTVDPFVPKFDIMKVKDLSKEMRKSQKINVESPRFVNTLKRALFEMFELADKDKSGQLSYQEFYDAFKTLSYGLSENDIKTLVALADENDDGLIDWEEFIPIGIESIQTFFARNKTLQRAKAYERELNKEAMLLVYQDEIKKANEILQKKFVKIDEQKTGHIPIIELKKSMFHCNLITPKEINIIMRSLKDETFEYKLFQQTLFDVRFELAKSRIMDTNIDKLQEHLNIVFSRYDPEQTGQINILQIQEALLKSKKVNLTPFQIHSLIGLSCPDAHGMVVYKEFAPKCRDMINELFTVKSLSDKSTLMQTGAFKPQENLDEINLSGLDLFKKYDRNQNGFLEIHEYIQCLKDSDVKLTEPEIITLGLSADINGDGRIDYEEFMKHFQDCLKLIRLQSTLQDAYNLYNKQSAQIGSKRPGAGIQPAGGKLL